MAGITSGIGAVSGFPIQDTIDKLIKVASRPKDLLTSRNNDSQSQQVAIGQIQALVLAIQSSTKKLATTDLFGKKAATSTDDKLLSATISGTALTGNYSYTPVRVAQAQQLLSGGLVSNTAALGAGTFTFGFEGYVNDGASLDQLNGGAGFKAGKIRITDRGGNTADIDLRYAQDIDDVLDAINSNTDISVTASTDGDRIKLTDNTGLTTSNLRVQEIGSGTTAASLGLSTIDVAANSATGNDIVSLYNSLALNRLNDGNGLSIRKTLADLEITFRDGSAALQIDFNNETTLNELLTTINAADPTRLVARISADGDHLEFEDLTSGSGTFAATSPFSGNLAEDLGLAGATASGGVLTSARLHSGLKTSLLSSFNGGAGLGTLGTLSLTDRSGSTANVDLSAAETLDDVLDAINSAGIGVKAAVNASRNGLQLTDTTGATTSNLIVANGDATNTADKLQLAVNSATTKVNSRSLNLQTVSENTALDSLNGGKGIFRNSVIITNSAGTAGTIRLQDTNTIGDVIKAINDMGINVEAKINETGDGIRLIDTAGGNLNLKVRDVGSGRGAKELRLAGESAIESINGSDTVTINGALNFKVTLDSDDTLKDLATKINDLGVGVSATVISTGSGATPYRLALTSQRSGSAGRVVVDGESFGITFDETARGQNALLAVGTGNINSGLLVSSNSNEFTEVLPGVKLTIKGQSTSTVNIAINTTNSDFVATMRQFVDSYNRMRDEYENQTEFNENRSLRGRLFGSHVALRIDQDLGGLVSGQIAGAGGIRSLEEIGVEIDDKGKLILNESVLNDKLTSNGDAVKAFFATQDTGLGARLNTLIDSLANGEKSLMETQKTSLQARISANQVRIDLITVRLENQRSLLEKQFYAMENAIAKLQGNQSSLATLAKLANVSTATA